MQKNHVQFPSKVLSYKRAGIASVICAGWPLPNNEAKAHSLARAALAPGGDRESA